MSETDELQARIAELEAERDHLQAKVAHLDKLADLYPISLGNACEDRDKLKHSDRALRKENAALRKALEDAPHEDCASVRRRHRPGFPHYETDWEKGCPDYHYEALGPCDCWKSRIPLPTQQSPELSLLDSERAGDNK